MRPEYFISNALEWNREKCGVRGRKVGKEGFSFVAGVTPTSTF